MSDDPARPPPSDQEVKRLREKYGVDKPAHDGVAYSAAGMELAMIVVVCGAIGFGLDRWLGTSPWFLLGLLVFGIVGAMVRLIRRFS